MPMLLPDWLTELLRLRDEGVAAVLVTVADVRGSAPREAGARMVVGPDRVVGTIGGGHLEWQATAIARDSLGGSPGGSPDPASGDRSAGSVRRFALGASLGQCCGGSVTLWFEAVAPQATGSGWLDTLADRLARGETTVFESRSGAAARSGRRVLPDGVDAPSTRLGCDPADGSTVLIDPVGPPAVTVAVFGAGHVGQALVPILIGCGVRLIWIDPREDAFGPDPSRLAGIDCRRGDDPVGEVAGLPPGCHCLVLTHSHALDEALAVAILRRDDLGWFGLIGSMTKRRRFEARLLGRGIDSARVARMDCPIGIPGIDGKAPGVVAVAIAARLLQVAGRQTARGSGLADQAAIALRRHGDSVK